MLGKADFKYGLPFYGTRRPVFVDLILKSLDEIDQFRGANINQEGGALITGTTAAWPRGRTNTVLAKDSLLYDKRGAVADAIESVRDINDTKHLEEALRQSEA
ncbi:MAG: hypothetical protein WCF90_06140 [Methanomicrobiales archaeon]